MIIKSKIKFMFYLLFLFTSYKAMAFLYCPGTFLVQHCGNGTCEKTKGENTDNCAADCKDSLVKSYNLQTLCTEGKRLYEPANQAQVAKVIQLANDNGSTVKVVGNSHSANDILCNDGYVISTQNLNQIYGIEEVNGVKTVHVDGGVKLGTLMDWLHEHNLSLGYGVMGFRGVSIAGAVATGSHGSSPKHSAIISANVEALNIVTASGHLQYYSKEESDTERWKALTVNLGRLGVVTDLYLKVRPQFNLKVDVDFYDEKEIFSQGKLFEKIKNCDFALVQWFPGTGQVMQSCGVETDQPSDPDAHNVLLDPPFPKYAIKPLKSILQLGACHKRVGCFLEKMRVKQYKWRPPFMKRNSKNNMVYSRHVIGPGHKMMSSDLTSGQKGFFQMDWEVAVGSAKLQEALGRVREIVKSNKVCLPLVGVFLRFAKQENPGLLSHIKNEQVTGNENIVTFIEMPIYLPVGFNNARMKRYLEPYESYVKMLIEEYDGKGHWGKNMNWVFELEKDKDIYGVDYERFQEQIQYFDPNDVFSSQWYKNIDL